MPETTETTKDLPADTVLLRHYLNFDPATGVFTWKNLPPNKRAKVGDQADTPTASGYRRLCVEGRQFLAHRAAWLHFYGQEPPLLVDHINGNGNDNRITNLRPADHSENMWNRQGKHEISGAVKHRRTGRYSALIRHRGERIYLGNFKTKEEAQAAYQQAATQLRGQFHE